MFEVGQKVKVTDQSPPAYGVIVEVSTWGEVLGDFGGNDPCYLVQCEEWGNTTRWISGTFVERD